MHIRKSFVGFAIFAAIFSMGLGLTIAGCGDNGSNAPREFTDEPTTSTTEGVE